MTDNQKPTTTLLAGAPADLIDAPSAAATTEAPCQPGIEDCPQPITAWTTHEDAAGLAEGLRMRENPAEWAFVRLSRLIQDFEKQLDENSEIGALMANGPGDAAFAIRDLGFWGPDFILFMGVNSVGRPIRLVQHYTQVNVLLSAVPKQKPEEPPRRIGFALQERVEKTQADRSPETSD
ncbi:DUF6173 family protein [Brevundimonas aveniformis]|uniref:DUF6173 family protein n=1 Tax=Brevundimonas aveniformis TaxID=370977 RepID=UPI002491658B|nr:DUF6173 family protein [Brevundimonas aveniformis]